MRRLRFIHPHRALYLRKVPRMRDEKKIIITNTRSLDHSSIRTLMVHVLLCGERQQLRSLFIALYRLWMWCALIHQNCICIHKIYTLECVSTYEWRIMYDRTQPTTTAIRYLLWTFSYIFTFNFCFVLFLFCSDDGGIDGANRSLSGQKKIQTNSKQSWFH